MLLKYRADRFKDSDRPWVGIKRFGWVLKPHESQPSFRRGPEQVMDFRQYSVFGQPHGYCGWNSR